MQKPGYFISFTNLSNPNCIWDRCVSDYYPFGSPMVGRGWEAGNIDRYRFGFNGQEKDNDISGEDGVHLVFEYRIHDVRLGRFLSSDPLEPEYPWNSPYAFAENRCIDGIDLEGLEWQPINDKGENVDISKKENKSKVTDYKYVGFISDGKGGWKAPLGTVKNATLTIEKSTFNYSTINIFQFSDRTVPNTICPFEGEINVTQSGKNLTTARINNWGDISGGVAKAYIPEKGQDLYHPAIRFSDLAANGFKVQPTGQGVLDGYDICKHISESISIANGLEQIKVEEFIVAGLRGRKLVSLAISSIRIAGRTGSKSLLSLMPSYAKNNGVAFAQWLEKTFQNGATLTTKQADELIIEANRLGLKIGPPEVGKAPYNYLHVNITKMNGASSPNAHLPVPKGYSLPKGIISNR